jgi:hypothetical protein
MKIISRRKTFKRNIKRAITSIRNLNGIVGFLLLTDDNFNNLKIKSFDTVLDYNEDYKRLLKYKFNKNELYRYLRHSDLLGKTFGKHKIIYINPDIHGEELLFVIAHELNHIYTQKIVENEYKYDPDIASLRHEYSSKYMEFLLERELNKKSLIMTRNDTNKIKRETKSMYIDRYKLNANINTPIETIPSFLHS